MYDIYEFLVIVQVGVVLFKRQTVYRSIRAYYAIRTVQMFEITKENTSKTPKREYAPTFSCKVLEDSLAMSTRLITQHHATITRMMILRYMTV